MNLDIQTDKKKKGIRKFYVDNTRQTMKNVRTSTRLKN